MPNRECSRNDCRNDAFDSYVRYGNESQKCLCVTSGISNKTEVSFIVITLAYHVPDGARNAFAHSSFSVKNIQGIAEALRKNLCKFINCDKNDNIMRAAKWLLLFFQYTTDTENCQVSSAH